MNSSQASLAGGGAATRGNIIGADKPEFKKLNRESRIE